MKVERPEPSQPLPNDAKCVFKGILFEVYQWEQELFDGSMATFERLKRPDTAVVIPIIEDGHILIIEEEQPGRKASSLDFPAGRIERDEDPAAAARRELLEETGYAPDELELWEATQPVSKIDWAVFIFIARKCRKVAEPHLDAGEKIKTQLTTFEDILTMAGAGQFDTDMAFRFLRVQNDPRKLKRVKGLFGLV